ncbi:hypothetical protein MHM88_14715 [Epibacterium sp. MM17-32]|uniref:hypothetical protein n=1 Tax=Epibacterium sp. MM17-32 TaxID=2917734 RepID=UPI001EF61682|nr:hypothetical protein [Epibacterium sp. MM17-32]MCG7629061.1 hypothetical protein [Epibacterium sp. MM17-32]
MSWKSETRRAVERVLLRHGAMDIPTALNQIEQATSQPVVVDVSKGIEMMQNETLVTKLNKLLAPAIVESNPISALHSIIDATVLDEHKKRVLTHNLDVFHTKLKEAQHAH